jgi:hypothetical protein
MYNLRSTSLIGPFQSQAANLANHRARLNATARRFFCKTIRGKPRKAMGDGENRLRLKPL